MAEDKLRGLLGQRLAVRRSGQEVSLYVNRIVGGSYSITSPGFRTQVDAFLWGAGGGAQLADTAGAGGGEAVYKRLSLAPFSRLPLVVGAGGVNTIAATDTTLTLPNGFVLRAHAGANPSGATPGAGGTGGNGDINRAGGAGGVIGTNGMSGTNGGAGGVGDGADGGGGGSGGFTDYGDLLGGAGGASATGGVAASTGSSPGGGAGGGAGIGPGGAGRAVLIFTRLRS